MLRKYVISNSILFITVVEFVIKLNIQALVVLCQFKCLILISPLWCSIEFHQ